MSFTLTFVPARTLLSAFTSPSAFAKMFTGLARRISSPRETGVRPKPKRIVVMEGIYISTVSKSAGRMISSNSQSSE